MILREREEEFVMIEQDHHGHLSERIMSHWKKELFPGIDKRDSVLTAIKHHDLGWLPFDKEPFWNDAKQKPYSFTDFPFPAKMILYKQGLDLVEQLDPYAAILCSEHYSQFLIGSKDPDAFNFLEAEFNRRQRLKNEQEDFDEQIFKKHYGLLQLGDNFSLYACMNEPGVVKSEQHPFFEEGIPSPKFLEGLPSHRMDVQFADSKTICVESFPFNTSFEIEYTQRIVTRQAVRDVGLIKAYNEARVQTIRLDFKSQ